MRIMNEQSMSEEDAYKAADRILYSENVEASRTQDAGEFASLVDPSIENDEARLYVASLRDSQRDKALFKALVKEVKAK